MSRPIIKVLSRHKFGLSLSGIAKELKLSQKDRAALKERLVKLENKGVILKLRKKYFLKSQSKIIRGTYISSRKGFGFVIPLKGEYEDVFIPGRYSEGALKGDLVEVFIKKGKKNRLEGRVLSIVKKKRKYFLGIYQKKNQIETIEPLESIFQSFILAPQKKDYEVRSGMLVGINRESKCIEKVYGFPDEPGVDRLIVIDRYGIKSNFSEEVKKEVFNIPDLLNTRSLEGRADFRQWRTFTIDGSNARDYDDAISIQRKRNGNFHLGVHIADVSHYVKPGSAIDQEAFLRSTSVYFPEKVIPMLPEKLSNTICSLIPEKEKLTISVLMEFLPDGHLIQSDIKLSVIKTSARLTYKEVYSILEIGQKSQIQTSIISDLEWMKELAVCMRTNRKKKGSLNLDLQEPELIYDNENKIQIVPSSSNMAHHIIEEFMISANTVVAEFLSKRKHPVMFRTHLQPSKDKISILKDKINSFSGDILFQKESKCSLLSQIIEKFKGKKCFNYIAKQVLRSLELAVYSYQNQGHFGLAIDRYAHFTSPIRRYPDLMVHRVLKSSLLGQSPEFESNEADAKHCSKKERNAEEAERELLYWRIYRFLKSKLGDHVNGVIIEFLKTGMVVELSEYFVDGFIPYIDLNDDFYIKKAENILAGKKSGRTFYLGEQIEVVLTAVTPYTRKIILLPVSLLPAC